MLIHMWFIGGSFTVIVNYLFTDAELYPPNDNKHNIKTNGHLISN